MNPDVAMISLPDEIVMQFRAVALERLERIETAWQQVLSTLDDAAANLIDREVHTLKGEAQMVGFADINLVCHRLEDLVRVARARGYAVDEDFDLVVNMALRFMTMLVRKRVGSTFGGIDMPGFVRQIDSLLDEHRPVTGNRPRSGSHPNLQRGTSDSVPPAVRERLAMPAVDAFIEYAGSHGPRRNRLRASWHALRDLIGLHRAVVGLAQLGKHRAATIEVAQKLGKQVDVRFELATAEVTTQALAALDLAVLHLVRNAVDHGIEGPEARGGKPAKATIVVRGQIVAGRFVLVVEDDGKGIDFGRVHARAQELGLVGSDPIASISQERWLEILCSPGFSTRTEASEISGRGVGLDAVRVAVVALGGKLSLRSIPGSGTSWEIAIPIPELIIQGHFLRVPRVPFPIVISSEWVEVGSVVVPGSTPVDIAAVLGLAAEAPGPVVVFESATRPAVAVHCESPTTPVRARRVIATAASAIGEVVLIDGVEALYLRLERVQPA